MSVRARVFCEKAEDLLPRLPADSFDSIVCDPPYGLAEMPSRLVVKALTEWVTGNRMFVPDGKGFMSKDWDRFVPPPGIWDECFRVMKPGAYLLAFAAPRTAGLMDISIRLAGFEIVDTLHWVFGSGMPKSHNISKAIDKAVGAQREVVGSKSAGQSSLQRVSRVEQGYRENLTACTPEDIPVTIPATPDAALWSGWGTGLKPAHEPIILARKPLAEGTYAANVLRWGTGGLNVDGCKVAHANGADLAESQGKNPGCDDTVTSGVYGADRPQQSVNAAGRWPPNLLLTHSADCRAAGTRRVKPSNGSGRASDRSATPGMFMDKHAGIGGGFVDADGTETVQAFTCAPDCPVAGLDAQSGTTKSPKTYTRNADGFNSTSYGKGVGESAGKDSLNYGDTGGASRFFPAFTWSPEYDLPFMYQAKAPKRERPRIVTDDGRVIQHPTVKPLSIMKWLVRLVTPPGGVVLDPFTGTGPVVQAALDEGMRCVACDQDPDSVALSRVRLAPYAGVKFTVPEPAEPEEAECG